MARPRIVLVAFMALALLSPASHGHAASRADNDIGDGPVIKEHVDEADCESGALTLDQMIERGRVLFLAKFNSFDGQGRPAATGNGMPTRRLAGSAPAFVRTSSPEANSCAGCHNDPRPGGGGDFVANVFVLAQVLDPVSESVAGGFSDERNTLGMMGSGAIEMLAREMTTRRMGDFWVKTQLDTREVHTSTDLWRTIQQTFSTRWVSLQEIGGILAATPNCQQN